MFRSYFLIVLFGTMISLPILGSGGALFKAMYLRVSESHSTPASWTTEVKDLGSWASNLNDRMNRDFAFRDELLRLGVLVHSTLNSRITNQVVSGQEGWLFANIDGVFDQVTGRRLNRKSIGQVLGSIDWLRREAIQNGRRFRVVIVPNKHTVYSDKLPKWAQLRPQLTEIDLLVAELADAGINFIDPRRELIEKSEGYPVYWRGDTHWTELGAWLTFDGLRKSLGWSRSVESSFFKVYGGKRIVRRKGDLVRLARLPGRFDDVAPIMIAGEMRTATASEISYFSDDQLSGYIMDSKQAGPTVLMIGDSFTRGYFLPLFRELVGKLVWTHHRLGKFNRSLLKMHNPDIVVFQVAERFIGAWRGT